MEKVPDFQRVLVLQGGGSLGAYEAGVYYIGFIGLRERVSNTLFQD